MTIREYDFDDQQQANELLAETTANFVAYLALEYELPVTRATFMCGVILQVLPEKLHETVELRESFRQMAKEKFMPQE
ncbi:hypothetical protein Nos7524_3086 [Nostoc sp. PCC 7524]|uniref:hypothetical protein n=1 Tax=Nostoc sp. (strain ATCC 29411 / PCC 7524) TaxID=28072 RepID=UPI00029ED348|nr:hypothetical protein [Nostoc sp. PCC 7524]AFY48889.1 hypothetical protein Nos7524_3086 [Nostoc sp. PCC 7524]